MKALPIIAIALVIIGFLVVVYTYGTPSSNGTPSLPNLPNLPNNNPPSTTPDPDIPTANPPVTPQEPSGPPPTDPAEDWGTTYSIQITAMSGGSTSPSPGVHDYANFTYVTVAALPSSGHVFDYWKLDDSPNYIHDNPIQIYMNYDHRLAAYFSDSVNYTYRTKYFLQNYLLTPTLQGGGDYEGTTSVTYNYPLSHVHSVYVEYQKVGSEAFGILEVKKDGVSLYGGGHEGGGLWVGDNLVHSKLLDTNSQAEQRTYTLIWSPQGNAQVRLSFYITEWPSSLSIFGEYDAYIGPMGIIMIAAGVVLLALMGKR